ncbi:E3 ubiquitin-protein ligase RNF152-like [Engraulis encrasicolus]|uniref:E3 ubiquitin-protein ligase RNF152-like n=1 Tax=Engraulis encrasicolus TaxID=184585 RepID=UPI002FCF04E0
METLPPDSILECQICFNYYSPRRRPKLLDCHHTCCSVCLTQMRSGAREVRCPWCRRITRLPAGLTSVSQLPDDPDLVAVVAIPHASEHTPVFIRLPSNGCYMLPLPMAKERALLPGELGCRLLPGGAPGLGGGSGKGGSGGGMAVLAIPEQEQLGLGSLEGLDGLEEGERRGGAMGGGGGVGGGGGGMGGGKGSTWSGVCTVILVACVLLFLLGIVLHNMSCISKRFTVISCG